MNRYATIAVLALATFALAVSGAPSAHDFSDEEATQAALATSDDEETAAVHANSMGVFADFCIQARDFVFADVKERAGAVSSQGFSSFFQMADDITREALSVQEDATNRLAGQLANPGSEVEGEGTVAEAQREISGQQQPLALVTAVRGTLTTTAAAVVNAVTKRVETMKAFANLDQFVAFAQNGCGLINAYEEEIRARFEVYKQQNLVDRQEGEKYAFLPLDKVPCVTATRIIRGNGICGFVKVAFQPAKKILGYSDAPMPPATE